ncbi:MAG: GrpB family protein [Clostridia bacterium]|nr:GrpB family protein [Clostridia bacterium]
MTLGLKHGTVALFPHETAWEEEAERTIGTLKTILGDAVADAQHVGSTAIGTIAAKPIVDIAVAADDFEKICEKQSALQAAGFYYRRHGEDLPGQMLFARGSYYDGTGDGQTHFVHVVLTDSAEWRDYINFRDYMNAFPAAAKEYEALKLRLAAECPADAGREHYLAGKHDFIRRALRKATVWSYLGERVHIGIDRPVGYVHKKESYALTYPINYGYIPGVIGGDGEELDVYLLGVTEPVREADCRVIGVVRRRNDNEDKLIAAPEGMRFTEEEMTAAVRFQEQWYDTFIIPESEKHAFEETYER